MPLLFRSSYLQVLFFCLVGKLTPSLEVADLEVGTLGALIPALVNSRAEVVIELPLALEAVTPRVVALEMAPGVVAL